MRLSRHSLSQHSELTQQQQRRVESKRQRPAYKRQAARSADAITIEIRTYVASRDTVNYGIGSESFWLASADDQVVAPAERSAGSNDSMRVLEAIRLC